MNNSTGADAPRLRFHHHPAELADRLLGAILYGESAVAEAAGDSRLVAVPLECLPGSPRIEAWYGSSQVVAGTADGVRFRHDQDHLFGVIEIEESAHTDLRSAAAEAYRRLTAFSASGAFPHPWRIWNFIDAINEGVGDDERYRRFCQGRADVLEGRFRIFPAGSALGRRDGRRIVQVIWLAGRTPGTGVENPRQISAFEYPRTYGPSSPSFSRAMRLGSHLLISGTASIVGHRTIHAGDPLAQLAVSIENMEAVARASGVPNPALRELKVYLRHREQVPTIVASLRQQHANPGNECLLMADICREDLLLELEAVCRPES